jgi:dCTP diphosphatase
MMDRSTAGREGLGLEELRGAINAFIRERDWEQFHSPKNLAMALSVEVSEIVEHLQWLTEEQSQNLPPKKLAEIREEIGGSSPTVTLVGNGPVNTAWRTHIEESIDCEDDQATLQGA